MAVYERLSLVKQRQNKFLGTRPVWNTRGEFLRFESIYTKKPFRELTVAQTLGCDVTCRVCMGAGVILNDSSRMGLIENVCGKCNGTKKMRAI